MVGDFWTLFPGGGGGVKGTLAGGIDLSTLGTFGEGVAGETAPGGGGIGVVAVLLWVPGSTKGLVSCIEGFVIESGFLLSAKVRCQVRKLAREPSENSMAPR